MYSQVGKQKTKNNMKIIGIIGGSGLEDLTTLIKTVDENIKLKYFTENTKYGLTSPIAEFTIEDYHVYLVSRHGLNHEISPSDVNYLANIYFLHFVGCTEIISITACGSLKEHINIGDMVFVNQFIDFTSGRINYIPDSKKVKHTAMAQPIDKSLMNKLIDAAKELSGKHISTVVTIPGPRFSTVAESKMYRIWGADIINMTSSTEISLANEFEIPIAVIAMVTDYDAWKEYGVHANWEDIKKIMRENTYKIIELLKKYLIIEI